MYEVIYGKSVFFEATAESALRRAIKARSRAEIRLNGERVGLAWSEAGARQWYIENKPSPRGKTRAEREKNGFKPNG